MVGKKPARRGDVGWVRRSLPGARRMCQRRRRNLFSRRKRVSGL